MPSPTSARPAKRPRIQKQSTQSTSSHINNTITTTTRSSTSSNSMATQHVAAAAAHAPGRWRDSGRPVPHDILLLIARYLGDMQDDGDIQARLTLAAMMRLSSDGFDAAARTLYTSITVTRDTFSQLFGGNDIKKSKLFEHPVTFPTRESVVRKLGLFQWVKYMHVEDLPSEQAVSDLLDAFRVACSQPASGVACQQALGGRLFPRLEGVSFGPNVFLNHHSTPPLGPENEGGLHRFLMLLRREVAPTHMCLELPTPAHIAVYKDKHRRAERPRPPSDPVMPDPAAPAGGAPALPSAHESSLVRAEEAAWPAILARAWAINTLSVHNVRFTRSIHHVLLALPCERLRIFAMDGACSVAMCEDGSCGHCDLRWSRAGQVLQSMIREDKDGARFKVVEFANVGAGYPLKCRCVDEYSNAVALLKSHLHNRAEEAEWKLDLPHCAEAVACECCGAPVAQTGDTGDGSPTGSTYPSTYCSEGHRWEKGFRQEPIAAAVAAAAAQGPGLAQPAAPQAMWNGPQNAPPSITLTGAGFQQPGNGFQQPGNGPQWMAPVPPALAHHAHHALFPHQVLMPQQLQAQQAMQAAQQALQQAMQAQMGQAVFPNPMPNTHNAVPVPATGADADDDYLMFSSDDESDLEAQLFS